MGASIEIPFAIGATVWHARGDSRRVLITCPACAGTAKHRVILGNGEEYVTGCGECGSDRSPDYNDNWHPGQVYETRHDPLVERVTLSDVRFEDGKVDSYLSTSRHYCYPRDLFDTEAAAMARANERAAESERNEEEQRLHNSTYRKKGNAATKAQWSVIYYRRLIADHEKHLGWAKARIELIKSTPIEQRPKAARKEV